MTGPDAANMRQGGERRALSLAVPVRGLTDGGCLTCEMLSLPGSGSSILPLRVLDLALHRTQLRVLGVALAGPKRCPSPNLNDTNVTRTADNGQHWRITMPPECPSGTPRA